MTHNAVDKPRMSWDRLLSPLRFGENQRTLAVDAGRTPFHKDYDRLIFSPAFRRLDRKTQVHPLTDNDHIHSRLTHSLEVACVGRSLATLVAGELIHELPAGTDPSDVGAIVQAACLAHDIGNPPFGHTGEDAIRSWFRSPGNKVWLDGLNASEIADLQNYEGNAQGLRLLTQIDGHRFDGGLRLTSAVLGSFVKYPWGVEQVTEGHRVKFGCYQNELPALRELAGHLGLIEQQTDVWCRHPLVYLVEAADDICYGLIDLEDGIEMHLLTYDEVIDLIRPLFGDRWVTIEEQLNGIEHVRRRLQILRGEAMEVMVQGVSHAFKQQQERLMTGCLDGDLIRYASPEIQNVVSGAKTLAKNKIFKDSRKVAVEVGAYASIGQLLDVFISAVHQQVTTGQSSFRNLRALEVMGQAIPDQSWSLYQAYLRACDFISGMTDHYAARVAQQCGGYRP